MDDNSYHQNLNPTFTQLSQIFYPSSDSGNFLDHHTFEVGSDQDLLTQFICNSENNNGCPIISDDAISSSKSMGYQNEIKMNNEDQNGPKVMIIRTKSDLEVMDDGFKWRKYGKKKVKTNPNPRNYYRCSSEGCNVKKRVERDGKDPSYVITTYEGIHNHHSPSIVYCANTRNELPHAWSLQPSDSSSHSFP